MKSLTVVMLAAVLLVPAPAPASFASTLTGTVVTTTAEALVIDTDMGVITLKRDAIQDRSGSTNVQPGNQVEIVHEPTAAGLDVVTAVNVIQPAGLPDTAGSAVLLALAYLMAMGCGLGLVVHSHRSR